MPTLPPFALPTSARRFAPPRASRAGVLALCGAIVLVAGGSLATAQPASARIAATIEILADGEAPWEDRPLAIESGEVLTGTAGVADPGDDLGPNDGVVRTYDVMAYRISYDVLDASARDLVIELELPSALRITSAERSRLRGEGCPGGVTAVDVARIACRIGDVAQSSITGYVDIALRVRGSAPHGTRAALAAHVTAANGRPDPDRCTAGIAGGCTVRSAEVAVSAALGLETGIYAPGFTSERTLHQGIDGWIMSWPLHVFAGGDGDPRGDAATATSPIALHDWWRATLPGGAELPGFGELLTCNGATSPGSWQCDVNAAPQGGPAAINLGPLDADAPFPSTTGVVITRDPMRYASVIEGRVRVFFPRQAVLDAGGIVNVTNCFATVPGDPNAPEFAPLDLAGNPNLVGLAEPLANNCLQRTLTASEPQEYLTGLGKNYLPGRWNALESVAAGERFEGAVAMANYNDEGGKALDGVVVCDKFDNATQEYVARQPGMPLGADVVLAGGVHVDVSGGSLSSVRRGAGIDGVAQDLIVEFGTGPWGRAAPAGSDRAAAWHALSVAGCSDDLALGPAGWVPESQVDMTNSGRRAIDAADVNMIRLRLQVPLPAGITVRVRFPLRALPNPPGTFLINYGTGRFGGVAESSWGVGPCFGAVGNRCPDPPSLDGELWNPGPFGDAMVLIDAPTSVWVRVEGDERQGTVQAGGIATLRLEARVHRDGDWPLQAERRASSVTVTDVLPSGLTYVPGSSILEAEDRNGNRRLDPDEDADGDGVLDPERAILPKIATDVPLPGQTTLSWEIGALLSGRQPRIVRFAATVDPLIPGGRWLATEASIGDAAEPPVACRIDGYLRTPDRCATGTFRIANTSRAAIDMAAEPGWVPPGQPLRYHLRAANLTGAPIEWLDATALLPWVGDPRTPASRFDGRWSAITATVPADANPIEVWASARPPAALDAADGPTPDGALDPVTAYGGPGAGLGAADWPCRLEDVAAGSCPAIPSAAGVTALRFWGLDPDLNARGTAATSRLPMGAPPLEIELALRPEQAVDGDRFHAAWGGRFHGLDLPAFAGAVARVGPPPRLYLPMVMRGACDPSARAIALVIDASTSMQRPSGIGGTKLDAVQDAARRLIDAALAEGDGVQQLAVVGFNDRAWVAQPITDDRASLERALDDLSGALAPGTRIDLGLAAGAGVLSGAGAGEGVLVLLTDGVPTGVEQAAVHAAAEAARASGTRILAIGYGRVDAPDPADRIDPGLLAAIAGPRGRSWTTPDADALIDVFDAIASEVACPVPMRWR